MRDRFREWRLDTPELDARLLAQLAFGLQRLELARDEKLEARPEAVLRLEGLAARRLAGEPVARILGRQEFYGLEFSLNAATLIPRPETELLVDLALIALRDKIAPRLLDLGTGTGCIPVAILANHADARAVAVDLSAEALDAASGNAARHGVADRLRLLQGSWFSPLNQEEKFDIIVSNPPYIETRVLPALQREVRDFDPALALDGGPDGLTAYRSIAAGLPQWLRPGGQVLLEIGHQQGAAVTDLLNSHGLVNIVTTKDLAGLDRVVGAHHFA